MNEWGLALRKSGTRLAVRATGFCYFSLQGHIRPGPVLFQYHPPGQMLETKLSLWWNEKSRSVSFASTEKTHLSSLRFLISYNKLGSIRKWSYDGTSFSLRQPCEYEARGRGHERIKWKTPCDRGSPWKRLAQSTVQQMGVQQENPSQELPCRREGLAWMRARPRAFCNL